MKSLVQNEVTLKNSIAWVRVGVNSLFCCLQLHMSIFSQSMLFLTPIGSKLRGLADAAEKYHVVLAENRKLYNEVQDLKGMLSYITMLLPVF